MPSGFPDRPFQNIWTFKVTIKEYIFFRWYELFSKIWSQSTIQKLSTKLPFKSVLPLRKPSGIQGNKNKASEHERLYKSMQIIINWHPISLIQLEYTNKKHSACFFYSSAEFKVNQRIHANTACLNSKDISIGNLCQPWHISDSAEQGAVKS